MPQVAPTDPRKPVCQFGFTRAQIETLFVDDDEGAWFWRELGTRAVVNCDGAICGKAHGRVHLRRDITPLLAELDRRRAAR